MFYPGADDYSTAPAITAADQSAVSTVAGYTDDAAGMPTTLAGMHRVAWWNCSGLTRPRRFYFDALPSSGAKANIAVMVLRSTGEGWVNVADSIGGTAPVVLVELEEGSAYFVAVGVLVDDGSVASYTLRSSADGGLIYGPWEDTETSSIAGQFVTSDGISTSFYEQASTGVVGGYDPDAANAAAASVMVYPPTNRGGGGAEFELTQNGDVLDGTRWYTATASWGCAGFVRTSMGTHEVTLPEGAVDYEYDFTAGAGEILEATLTVDWQTASITDDGGSSLSTIWMGVWVSPEMGEWAGTTWLSFPGPTAGPRLTTYALPRDVPQSVTTTIDVTDRVDEVGRVVLVSGPDPERPYSFAWADPSDHNDDIQTVGGPIRTITYRNRFYPIRYLYLADPPYPLPVTRVIPPLRQWPRSDGLAASSARRPLDTRTVQRSLRPGPGAIL